MTANTRTSSADHTPAPMPTSASGPLLPRRTVMIALAVLYAVLFIGVFVTAGAEVSPKTSGAKILAEYDATSLTVRLASAAMVLAAVSLIFYGAGLRRLLNDRRRDWTADVAFAGTITMAVTLVGFAVTALAMYDAVQTADPQVAQAINIMDNSNFVPAMLGLACTMLGAGLAGIRTGLLPRWLGVGSVVLGALAPLGAAAFAPFALFPVWLIVVAACARRTAN